jgi:hypothetical protein
VGGKIAYGRFRREARKVTGLKRCQEDEGFECSQKLNALCKPGNHNVGQRHKCARKAKERQSNTRQSEHDTTGKQSN